jgi:hypothetical protein
MQARLDFRKASPAAGKAIGDLHAFVHRRGLEHGLLGGGDQRGQPAEYRVPHGAGRVSG